MIVFRSIFSLYFHSGRRIINRINKDFIEYSIILFNMKFFATFAFLTLTSTTTLALKIYDHEQAPTLHTDHKIDELV